jgi:hypothetical protein
MSIQSVSGSQTSTNLLSVGATRRSTGGGCEAAASSSSSSTSSTDSNLHERFVVNQFGFRSVAGLSRGAVAGTGVASATGQ